MFALLRLPPGTALIALGGEDVAELVKIVGRFAVVHETATAFERLPDKRGNPERYVYFGQNDDPRLVALQAEVKNEAAAEMARMQARLESFLSGSPVEIKDERPLAAVLPHKSKESEP